MNLSPSMQFVMMRASAEAQAAHIRQPGVECMFLGVLKLAIDAYYNGWLRGESVFVREKSIPREAVSYIFTSCKI